MSTVRNLIIIGSGPAGLTAAIYAARANLKPLIIEGKSPGGQLMGTNIVENWPGEKSILGPKLMMNMREHAQSFDTEFVAESVEKVDFSKRPFTVTTDKNKTFQAHAIIIATGATSKKLNVTGEDVYWGKGITTCAVCDGVFYTDKKVVVIGGGDTAMEEASFLKKFTRAITVIQIGDKLSASYAMQQKVVTDSDITIIYNTAVTEFTGDGNHLQALTMNDKKTGKSSTMKVDGAFIAIGLNPNTKPFQGHIELDTWGYIKMHDQTKTSVEGVFVAGDAYDFHYRQAITSAGSGCMAALDVERYLSSLAK